jgi:hypothetical protein
MKRYGVITLAFLLGSALILAVAGAIGGPGQQDQLRREVANPDSRQPAPRYTADELILLAIQEEGIARVREVASELSREQDPARRHALQQQVAEIKLQTRLRFLETLMAQARQRGDLAEAEAAQGEIERLQNPPAPAVVPIRQLRDKSRAEGGQR